MGQCAAPNGVTENISAGSDLVLQPNPASTEIKINLPLKNDFEIEIMNTLGESVSRSKNEKQINIADLPNGIYFLCVRENNNFLVRKFVKE